MSAQTKSLREAAIATLNVEFSRVSSNVKNEYVTPRLASLMFENFGRGVHDLLMGLENDSGNTKQVSLHYLDMCEQLNENHFDDKSQSRLNRPSDLQIVEKMGGVKLRKRMKINFFLGVGAFLAGGWLILVQQSHAIGFIVTAIGAFSVGINHRLAFTKD